MVLTKRQKSKLAAIISILDHEELKEVDSMIKVQWGQVDEEKVQAFRVEARVEFEAKKGETVTGTITKINRKTIEVTPDRGFQKWKVSPSLLRMSTIK